MKRLFIATKITLNKSLLQTISDLKTGCRFDKMTWVTQDVTHLTLRFLGKTPEEKIPAIIEAMQVVANKHHPMELSLDKLGLFGSRYAPSVIWLGFNDFAVYKALFSDIETKLLDLGFDPNYGNFVPHITLARIKQVENKKKFQQLLDNHQIIEPQLLNIDHITLYQSKLLPEGPVYREIAKQELGGGC